MSSSDDEVDILGVLPPSPSSPPHTPICSYSELLKCDYTVHPQWLLDSATTACWYDNPQNDNAINDSEDDEQPSTSNDIIKWSNSEKDKLQKGMEMYGQDVQRLSNFVGTKSPSEIRNFIEAEYGIDMDSQVLGIESHIVNETNKQDLEYGDILADNEIPASMEEVICMVNTAEPTVPNIKKAINDAKNKNQTSCNKARGLKNSQIVDNIAMDQKNFNKLQSDTLSVINEVCNDNGESLLYGIPKKSACSKSRNRNARERNKSTGDRFDVKKEKKINFGNLMYKSSGLSRFSDRKRTARSPKQRHVRSSSFSKAKAVQMEIVTGSGQAVPLSEGEQVIKIEKCVQPGEESDIEIDIDSENDNPPKNWSNSKADLELINFKTELKDESTSVSDEKDDILTSDEVCEVKREDVKTLEIPDSLKSDMECLDIPNKEYVIAQGEITHLEKILYPEFFEGRVSKTPERYILIRSHIFNCWNQCRPFYLTKTAARHGLKNCGDVNCIGRIHMILEQIGAINFGCEQTSYIRPLIEIFNKPNTSSNMMDSLPAAVETIDTSICDLPRQRKKKIVVDGAGGYTITHTELGEICHAISEPKQHRPNRKKPVNLIYCEVFTEDNPAPFHVQLSLSALILMDLHSYTSRAEVMGLLGGHYSTIKKTVSIKKYVPCNSLEDSGTHCDMCPVSQSAASELLTESGYETVGWHHSHPLFPPQPSGQDILSQADLQTAFSPQPFLALIISPYWPPGRTASQLRCFFTKKEICDSGYYNVAYKFKTYLHCDINDKSDVDTLLSSVDEIYDKITTSPGKFAINMNDVCHTTNMSYIEKCLSSIRHHLCGCDVKMDPTIYDSILNGIRNVFR